MAALFATFAHRSIIDDSSVSEPIKIMSHEMCITKKKNMSCFISSEAHAPRSIIKFDLPKFGDVIRSFYLKGPAEINLNDCDLRYAMDVSGSILANNYHEYKYVAEMFGYKQNKSKFYKLFLPEILISAVDLPLCLCVELSGVPIGTEFELYTNYGFYEIADINRIRSIEYTVPIKCIKASKHEVLAGDTFDMIIRNSWATDVFVYSTQPLKEISLLYNTIIKNGGSAEYNQYIQTIEDGLIPVENCYHLTLDISCSRNTCAIQVVAGNQNTTIKIFILCDNHLIYNMGSVRTKGSF